MAHQLHEALNGYYAFIDKTEHGDDRGFLRKGYKADIAVVRPGSPWTVNKDIIQSKCGWSPMEGRTFNWRVEHTFCNGRHIYNEGVFDDKCRGERIEFRR